MLLVLAPRIVFVFYSSGPFIKEMKLSSELELGVLSFKGVDFWSSPFCSLFLWFHECLSSKEGWRLTLPDLAYMLLNRALMHVKNWESLEDLATVPVFYTLKNLACFANCSDYRSSGCAKKPKLHTQTFLVE